MESRHHMGFKDGNPIDGYNTCRIGHKWMHKAGELVDTFDDESGAPLGLYEISHTVFYSAFENVFDGHILDNHAVLSRGITDAGLGRVVLKSILKECYGELFNNKSQVTFVYLKKVTP